VEYLARGTDRLPSLRTIVPERSQPETAPCLRQADRQSMRHRRWRARWCSDHLAPLCTQAPGKTRSAGVHMHLRPRLPICSFAWQPSQR